jgi:myo-inositol catabolism protein IolC
MPRGYDHPLDILPFDHRSSFENEMFCWDSPLSDAQTAAIAGAKQVIYDGFLAALAGGIPREKAGLLVDEQFGAAILRDASSKSIITPCPAEAAARAGGRHNVGCIILGRGADNRQRGEWLEIAAVVPGIVGFAIGRTVFWDPLIAWRSEQATRDQTVTEIIRRYRQFVDRSSANTQAYLPSLHRA